MDAETILCTSRLYLCSIITSNNDFLQRLIHPPMDAYDFLVYYSSSLQLTVELNLWHLIVELRGYSYKYVVHAVYQLCWLLIYNTINDTWAGKIVQGCESHRVSARVVFQELIIKTKLVIIKSSSLVARVIWTNLHEMVSSTYFLQSDSRKIRDLYFQFGKLVMQKESSSQLEKLYLGNHFL